MYATQSVQAAPFFTLFCVADCGGRALLTQTLRDFFSASFAFPFSLLVCHPLDASHYTDEVALNSFFSQFRFSCSFPVALSSG